MDSQEDGASVVWQTRIIPSGNDPTDEHNLTESPKLYITDTTNDAVVFTIDGGTFASYNAAGEPGSITFKFRAEDTSIKDGKLEFTLPSGWTSPKKPDTEAAGKLVVSGGDVEKETVSTAGQRVIIPVPALAPEGEITITYSDHEKDKITVQPNATAEGKPVAITGYFWTSKPFSKRRSAGKVEIEITSVDDGYGTATIEPETVKAGSDDNEITGRIHSCSERWMAGL